MLGLKPTPCIKVAGAAVHTGGRILRQADGAPAKTGRSGAPRLPRLDPWTNSSRGSHSSAWPHTMLRTLDPRRCSVSRETEVEAEAQKARADRERLEREARSVRLNGEPRDPQTVDWLALSQEISDCLPKAVLNRPIGTFADLRSCRVLPPTAARRGRHLRGRSLSRDPQEKKDMIGRLGELTVYHWLKTRQRGQDIDS